MKKYIASALTAVAVFGAASTTFAKSTEEEIAELKARIAELERIVQQQQNNSTVNNKEVSNLDSRVTDLEKSKKNSLADRFTIGGELRWSYWNLYKNPDASNLQIRILPTFKIDDHFAIKARFRGQHNTQNDTRAYSSNTAFRTDWMYLESKFGKLQVNAGKVPLYTNVDRGLVVDSDFSGVQVMFGNVVKAQVNAGHWSQEGNYIGAEVRGNVTENLNAGVGYHYFKQNSSDNKQSIVAGGIGYKFTPDVELFGAVAHNSKADSDKTAYNIELDYKGANRNVKSSWGVYAAYRYAPRSTALAATYNTFGQTTNKKGFEFGASWTPYKGIVTDIAYFHGKYFNNGGNDRTFFARARAYF